MDDNRNRRSESEGGRVNRAVVNERTRESGRRRIKGEGRGRSGEE